VSYYGQQLRRERLRAKRKQKRDDQTRRDQCRAEVYARAGGRCEHCGRGGLVLLVRDARHEFDIAHIDEVIPRSLGGDPLDPGNCQCLCHACHKRKTEHGCIGSTGKVAIPEPNR
jgi:5-methylcytosine-specific restriction endonuclease McrA